MMTPEQARTFRDDVLNIVSQIPRGRVTTYGYIATLAGWPSHSRMVGRTLRYTPGQSCFPVIVLSTKKAARLQAGVVSGLYWRKKVSVSMPTVMWT